MKMIITVPRSGPETLDYKAAAQHRSPDRLAVGEADRRRVRILLDQGGTVRPRRAVPESSRPGAPGPAVRLVEPAEDRPQDTGA